MSDATSTLPPGAENISRGGFNLHAGPIYRLPDDGAVRCFALPVLDKHLNGGGNVHGGLLMTFADISMSQTARAVTAAPGCNTVSMTCDFVGPGRAGETLECRVRITRQTRTLVFLSADITAGGRAVAVATGLWKIV
ncbi:MAG: PaaI family thioesterase [Alphaproteobacteria bacterium]|nr:PaaI family thioesterase [Alphaproteobacteria bacterium]MBL7096421.1 PaaI family thioesterase [Alphaproteobacteria bacterium]